jgi:hypothetical protein
VSEALVQAELALGAFLIACSLTHPLLHLLTEVILRPHLPMLFLVQDSELKRYGSEFISIRSPFIKSTRDIKY